MSDESQKHRSHLPMPNTDRVGRITFDAKDPDTQNPPIEQLRPPKGAPNVLIVLIDDAGFGSSSAFGGPCQTPNAEKLAAEGLQYNRFHTTALCSPTRQALLTGRNHHSVGMGAITELASGAPGYNSVLPNSCSPLARTLLMNGYSTAQFGKCHEVPVWETSPVGPFDAWPTGGGGFEYFYGFVGGEANQWYPSLYEGTTPGQPKKTPEEGYNLVEDMTDKAMSWIGQQKALAPDKPFFVYFAPGATHAPHHPPKEWADGKKVGEGVVPMTLPMVFSADDGCDVGEDTGSPVSEDYGSRRNAFNATVKGAQIDIADAAQSSDHLISPEDAIRIAMARQ